MIYPIRKQSKLKLTCLKTVAILFLITVSTSISAQKNDLDEFHLLGSVKSMIETKTDVARNVKNKTKGKQIIIFRKYDKEGNIIWRKRDFYFNDSLAVFYDANKRKVKAISYPLADSSLSNSNKYRYEYFYDQHGNETGMEMFYSDTITTCKFEISNKYNDQGMITEKIDRNVVGGLITRITQYKYDNGYKTETLDSDVNGQILEKYTYKNDVRGNAVEWTWWWFGPYGKVEHKVKYDEHNNEVQDIYINKNAHLKGKIKTKYNYDKTGNWIKETRVKKGRKQSFSTRLFEYY